MHAETDNPFTKRAITSLQIGEQEFEIEDQYGRRAQALATVAVAVELEQVRELLAHISGVLEGLVKETTAVSEEVSNVAVAITQAKPFLDQ